MKLKFIVTLLMLALPALAQQHIDLSGEWKFRSERETGVVRLPGSMLTNGKGDEVTVNTKWTSSLYDSSYYFNPYMARYRQAGQMKFPFFLTPDKHYVGNAWYERTVMVPKRWKGKPVMLYLERPHIETTVMVNGQRVGHQQSLSVPHVYDVTPYIKYGKPNQLTIQVYNGIENVCVGQDSHSVTDQTQGNWNGIVGKIELRQGPHIWRKRVVPDMQNGMVDITINETTYRLPLGSDTVRWDEFHPQLYTRTVNYQGTPVNVMFGLRELKIDGARMLINNHPHVPAWYGGQLLFPRNGLSTNRRGLVGACAGAVQGMGHQPHPIPLVLSTRGCLCRGRPTGIVSATRGSVVAQPWRKTAQWYGHRSVPDGRGPEDD